MKINVEIIDKKKEEQLLIECYEVTQQIDEIINFVKSRDTSLTAYYESQIYFVYLKDIYYIEAVDNKVFAYLENKVYELKIKLYEFEELYGETNFFRCSKSVIVNLMKIEYIKPALNGRFMATLNNSEKVIISRQYVAELKERLKGGLV
ncbi:MAG: LytTR family DNA-binding domain-containing protein [Sedimentibacter saalensis]|jgi:DNA-binding LytR/AlgR family response regulator|uniref:LytTR family transcriptional regulator n=1 Tax=Sedimentibacter saalensis TaxID=130788 RepID=A0A562JGQ9_9FIRM|nr:LytTR family DNA-binding domain-containing protein [Sedimentibacter saalensis]MEA5094307.1 LytTR family DNA-binding domain-containing protein [Sedimentibacter saalensis]TWH82367.1 LytTR family transcriptional regulator [Sedimentibacter saalensis]